MWRTIFHVTKDTYESSCTTALYIMGINIITLHCIKSIQSKPVLDV